MIAASPSSSFGFSRSKALAALSLLARRGSKSGAGSSSSSLCWARRPGSLRASAAPLLPVTQRAGASAVGGAAATQCGTAGLRNDIRTLEEASRCSAALGRARRCRTSPIAA
jgi:hypothetical protein